MTPTIAELRELCARVNPEPITADGHLDGNCDCRSCETAVMIRGECHSAWHDDPVCDICLIEFAETTRTAIPILIDEIERLREALKSLKCTIPIKHGECDGEIANQALARANEIADEVLK